MTKKKIKKRIPKNKKTGWWKKANPSEGFFEDARTRKTKEKTFIFPQRSDGKYLDT